MKKLKRVLSIFLSFVMIVTAITSTGMIAQASMLPLKEVKAYLVVGDHEGVDISAIPLDLILDNLWDSKGNKIEIDKDAKVAWCYCKDKDGSTITDDYFVIEEGGTVDLSIYEEYERYTLEMIVGDGKQLSSDNVRYIVTVYLSNRVGGLCTYELYTQSEDGTRQKIIPADQYAVSAVVPGAANTSATRVFIIPDHVEGTEYYLGVNDPLDEHPSIQCDVINLPEYMGFLIYQELGREYEYTNLADQFINQDMTKKDAGYKNVWDSPEYTEDSLEIKNTFAFIYRNSITGEILFHDLVTFIVTNSLPLFEEDAFDVNTSESVMLTSTSHVSINELKSPFELSADDITEIRRVILKEGYSADNEYRYALYADSPVWDNANDHVVKATEGFYNSLDAAAEATDISNQLLPKSNASGQIGYKANYNIAAGGVPVTIFFDDGTIYRFLIVFQDYDKNADLNYLREFTEMPIIGEADPWFRVTGATDNQGKAYDTYVIENGKSINMDTYYGYGYQTLFINDANADLTQLKPNFWYANTDRVYAVSKDTGAKVEEDHVRDFSNENQQYTGVIIDNGKENNRNYWVTFKKLNNNGPELYVFGPNEREVILDEYFEYKHDILIANIGNKPLEGLSVELKDEENVKLDSYWTVGGTNNDTLAPFTATSSDTEYGEIANIAKIRLLPDGDGEVKGTLIIRAKDQEPVLIELNGTAQQPEIVTETLSEAVKYVPYSHIVATNNIHDWNEVTFELYSGILPDGVELNTQTGEIYGTPKVAGEYHFTVEAKYTYFEPSFVELTLNVKDNTNDNVFEASDDGYAILDSIGEDTNGNHNFVLKETGDQVFRSNGAFADFVDFWLNGEKLVEGVDYDVSEGSTRITVRSQTFEDKANQDGSNTIAAEFRTGGGDPDSTHEGELKRTAQNFTMDLQKSNPAVDNVIALINEIPDTVKTIDKPTVEKARAAYNALTDTQKDKVTNYDKLTAAEKAISTLEENERRDKAAANVVVDMIDSLPSDITLNEKEAVNNARSAYENLTAQQKDYVTNLKKLVNAETIISELENENNQSNKYITFVGHVVDSNGKPMADVTVELHSEVQTARTNSNGFFRFNMVEMDKHSLVVKDSNGKVIASKDFSIIEGTPLSVNEDVITAENHSTFTMTVEVKGSNLFFKDLQEGDHTADPESSPQTGDSANLGLWYTLLILSLSGLFVMTKLGIRRKSN